jgi:hypothetical protein
MTRPTTHPLPLSKYSFFASCTILTAISQIASITDEDAVDFFDIPMDGINQPDELDEYLSQPIEKVRDPIAWWWDHRHVFPKLSKMAFDYLSVPGMCCIAITTDY